MSSLVVFIQAQVEAEIVFTSDQGGNLDIYQMNADGNNLRRLTNHSAQDIQPVWSPDRSQIAFISNRSGIYTLYVMDHEGNNIRQVLDDEFGSAEYPAWSPDGSQIIFASTRRGNYDLFTVQLSNREIQSLARTEDDELEPAWSADGRSIAFARLVEGAYAIYTMDMRTGQESILAQQTDAEFISPVWSPADNDLAYSATYYDSLGQRTEIAVFDFESRTTRTLISYDDMTIRRLSWSQTGESLLYHVSDYENRRENFYQLGIEGQSVRLILSSDDRIESPSWSSPAGDMAIVEPSTTNGPPPSRIAGRVTTPRLNVRSGPGPEYYIVARVSEGDTVQIIGRTADFEWVQLDTGVIGWINSDYVNSQSSLSVLPVQSATSPVPQSVEPFRFGCSGAYGPNFQIGDRFIVPYGDGPTSVWDEPNREPRITRIPEGQGGEILGGPLCVNGRNGPLIIYYVHTDSGSRGYLSEGYPDSPVPWITPAR